MRKNARLPGFELTYVPSCQKVSRLPTELPGRPALWHLFFCYLFSSHFCRCSHWSFFIDVPLIFSCPADHVPDWQPHISLGRVEARSVNNNVKNKRRHTVSAPLGGRCLLFLKKNQNAPRPSEHPPVKGKKCQNVY